VLINVSTRIDLAYKAFFRRVKQGHKPGYPRFRGKDRYDSFTYPQFNVDAVQILGSSFINLLKIGQIKIKYDRPAKGKIKTTTVRRTKTDKWFVSFSCEVDPKPLRKNKRSIGIDLGLRSFLTYSDGSKVENPRFFKQEQKELAKAHRKVSKAKKGSPKRSKAKKILSRINERVTNKRKDFAHKLSRQIVNKFGTIVIEDLNINDMKKDNFKCINRSISDVAWSNFVYMLSYKAVEAGRKLIKVNPAYTTQTCSRCGHRHKLKLSDVWFECSCCNLKLDRDHNAANNILALGVQSLTVKPKRSNVC